MANEKNSSGFSWDSILSIFGGSSSSSTNHSNIDSETGTLLGGIASETISSTGAPVTQDQINKALQTSIGKILTDVVATGGVAPAFFQAFPFLAFLDNSSNAWKSRLAALKNRTANERIAWYMSLIQETNDPQDAIQYSEMFGTVHEHIDDLPNVDFDLAVAFNATVGRIFFPNLNERIGTFGYDRFRVMCDLRRVKKNSKHFKDAAIADNGFDIIYSPQPVVSGSDNSTSATKSGKNILGVITGITASGLSLYKIFK